MSIEQALADNTAALNNLAGILGNAFSLRQQIASEDVTAVVAPAKSAKQQKAAQPAPKETTQSPSASTPPEESPASESESAPAAAAPINVNHIGAIVLALVKKGAESKVKAAGVLGKFGAKNVPGVKVADYDSVFAELKALLTEEEATAALAPKAA